jgi:SAM-dependent methyltransferase
LTRRRDPSVPPVRLQSAGFGDFQKVGEDLLQLLIDVGGLRPTDRVLDIGCGPGRVALPLTHYLQAPATYDGFDVLKPAIRWCQRHITPQYPNFRFHHVDVWNSEYGQRGVPASQFRFPFGDRSFEFVFATSVFTHTVVDETRQYLCESARVLAPGGQLLATFFLLNETSLPHLSTRNNFNFPAVSGSMRLLDADNPGVGVAVAEEAVLKLIREAGLTLERIAYGAWSGRQSAVTFQDLVVCRRAPNR